MSISHNCWTLIVKFVQCPRGQTKQNYYLLKLSIRDLFIYWSIHLLLTMATALARLNRRLGAGNTKKVSIFRALGLNMAERPQDAMALAWIRYQYSMRNTAQSVWGQTPGYVLYGALEYIVQHTEGDDKQTAVIRDVWNYIAENVATYPFNKLMVTATSEDAEFEDKDEADKLKMFVTLLADFKEVVVGFRGNEDIDSLVTKIIVSIMKRGTISPSLLTKLNAELSNDGMLSMSDPLNAEQIRVLFETFGKDFVRMNLHKDLVKAETNVNSIRFNLCRQRIKDASLTSYRTVQRAIEEVSSFPWDKVLKLFPAQHRVIQTLKTKLDANSFFGFDEGANEFGVTKFPDLYFLAKKLIVEVLGDRNLMQHQTNSQPSNLILLETLFKTYKANQEKIIQKQVEEIFAEAADA